MKKGFCAIIITFCLVLMSYVPVGAANLNEFILRTTETIDTTDEPLYSLVFREDDPGFMENILDAINTGFDFSDLSNYDYYAVVASTTSGAGTSASYQLHVYAFNSDLSPYFVAKSNEFKLFCSQTNAVDFHVGFDIDSNSEGGGWSTDALGINDSYFYNPGDAIDTNNYHYVTFSSSYYLLDCNFPVNSFDEISSHTGEDNDYNYTWATANHGSLTNLFANVPGYNAEGSITTGGGGSGEETNANHLYFDSCEIGFCEPAGVSGFNSFGGAYFYVKYSVDNWIYDHIDDYSLSFTANATVGQQSISGTSVTVPLSRDGCVVIPFNEVFTDTSLLSKGFVVSVSKELVYQNYYKAYLYSIAGTGLADFRANLGAASSDSAFDNGVKAIWNFFTMSPVEYIMFYTNNSMTEVLNKTISSAVTSIAQSYNPFNINSSCHLVDDLGGTSGYIAYKFDLYKGTSRPTDTGGLVNDNPYNAPDDPDQLPSVPQEKNPTNQGSVNNVNNININTSGTVSLDPAYDEIRDDVNSQPNSNMTQYLAPFKSNEGSSWFLSFLDDMPTEMKTILVAGCGVGVLFGIYRFIRRG